MDNIDKLFIFNSGHKERIKRKGLKINFYDDTGVFSGETIIKIINFVNSLHQAYKGVNIPIIFYLGRVKIVDKLSYIIFECICYSLMVDYHHMVYVYWKPENGILTDGVFSSPLNLLNDGKSSSAKKYPGKFKMDIYKNHFRRVINGENKRQTNYLGNLFQELDTFLKFFNIVREYRDQITEVIAELVGNACEHAGVDCLLDIDITEDHLKEVKNEIQEGAFYGINIAIVDFSDILLGTDIKKKLHMENITSRRYEDLYQAYLYHKSQFSDTYTEEDFCNIAALQDKISGRPEHGKSGGTGLTKLIRSLQEKSDMDSCYVVSGKRCVWFFKDKLQYNEQNWLGFNDEQDFIKAIPAKGVITPCYAYIPGTAYNLNFVMKREEKSIE